MHYAQHVWSFLSLSETSLSFYVQWKPKAAPEPLMGSIHSKLLYHLPTAASTYRKHTNNNAFFNVQCNWAGSCNIFSTPSKPTFYCTHVNRMFLTIFQSYSPWERVHTPVPTQHTYRSKTFLPIYHRSSSTIYSGIMSMTCGNEDNEDVSHVHTWVRMPQIIYLFLLIVNLWSV